MFVFLSVLHETVQKEVVIQILQHHSEILSMLTLPVEIVRMLCTEEVISKKTFDVVVRSRGSLASGPLRVLSNTVSDDPNQLRVFCTVLLQSEETVRVANNILKEYGKCFIIYSLLKLLNFYRLNVSSVTSEPIK